MNLTGADMQMREMQDRLAAVTAELAETRALLEAMRPFAHDVDVLQGILSDERKRAEAAEARLKELEVLTSIKVTYELIDNLISTAAPTLIGALREKQP